MRPIQAAVLAAFLFLEICMTNTLNAASLALNRNGEQCRLTAYDDRDPSRILTAATRIRGRLTIGWGHTGADVAWNTRWTQAEADAAQQADLAYAAETVRRHVTVPLTDNQFGALVDFAFNLGAGGFLRSSVLAAVNKGRHERVPDRLRLYVYSGGRRLPGLVARRTAEAALYAASDPPPGPLAVDAVAPLAEPLIARFGAWIKAHA